MESVLQRVKQSVKRSFERDRRVEPYAEAVSRRLWPWREQRLLAVVVVLVILDFISTYAFLQSTGIAYTNESGLLAGWALRMGGFGLLFLGDMGAVLALSLVAMAARSIYLRIGFKGLARAAFVLLLVPYAVMAVAAVINNVVLTVLWV